MRRRHFNSADNAELRAKIDKAKPRLTTPDLMRRLGYEEKHIGKSAHCPFHPDEHKSFSVFHSKDGKGWQWKCHAACGYGDEIAFLVKHLDVSRREAIRRYLDMAGFPARPSKSREYPESRASLNVCVSVSPVSPVSAGQSLNSEKEKVLRALAARNACSARNTAWKRCFKLARDLKAIGKRSGRQLEMTELTITFDEWHRLSLPSLDPAKTRDDYWMVFLAQLQKVAVPTGEGVLTKALENVAKLSLDQLPVIRGYPDAPEECRRLVALHCELSRSSANGVYFLSYRDAAKVCDGLSQQKAHTITCALATLGVFEIVNKGDARPNGGKASEFRYLLSQTDGEGFEL